MGHELVKCIFCKEEHAVKKDIPGHPFVCPKCEKTMKGRRFVMVGEGGGRIG